MIDTKPTTNGHGPATLEAPTAGKAMPHELTVGQANSLSVTSCLRDRIRFAPGDNGRGEGAEEEREPGK